MSQKGLALAMGVDQAVLCGMEKGRRGAASDEQMERAYEALGLGEAERRALASKVRNDALMRLVERSGYGDAAGVISAALRAHENLAPAGREGLLAMLQRAAASGAEVRALERLADGV